MQFPALPKTIPEAAENQLWNKCYKKCSYGLKNLPWRQEAAPGFQNGRGETPSFLQMAAPYHNLPTIGSQASEVKPTGSEIETKINIISNFFRDPLTTEIFRDVPYEITDF